MPIPIKLAISRIVMLIYSNASVFAVILDLVIAFHEDPVPCVLQYHLKQWSQPKGQSDI
jgi:hypothetical protein